MPSFRLVALLSACFLLAVEARAEGARSGKWWELYARAGVASDSNINHLLVNSVRESDVNRPDTILRSGAGFFLDPSFGKSLKTEWSYDYQRYDYSRNTVFSYYAHEVSADVYPRMSRRWSLDLGGDLDWVADKNGAIAADQTGRLGVVWSGASHLKIKAGVEYRNDSVAINPLKNGDSRIVYASAYKRVLPDVMAFGGYRYQSHSTAGPDFTYRAHSFRAGLIAHPTARLKVNAIASYAHKTYDNIDTRFLVQRRDRTFSATLKPSLRLADGLSAVASATYARNFSNVSIKEYSDRQFYVGLEGRL